MEAINDILNATDNSWPEAQPRLMGRGPVGVLLLHGFTGTPGHMYELGEYLAGRGFTVSIPLLAGHGSSVQDMYRTGRREWMQSAQDALTDLKARCSRVAVAGLSMGGLLTLRLAARDPDIAAACVLSAPLAYKIRRAHIARFIPKIPITVHWKLENQEPGAPVYLYEGFPMHCLRELLRLSDNTRRELHQVNCPTQCIYTTKDSLVRMRSLEIIKGRVPSDILETHILTDSPHASTIGREKEMVFALVSGFLHRVCVVV